MDLVLLTVAILLVSGIGAALCGRSARLAWGIGAGGTTLGGILGLIAAVSLLLSGQTESFRHAWQVPFGSLSLAIDPLTAFFLIPILGLSIAAAIAGGEILGSAQKGTGGAWFFFNTLVASMVVVVTARNAVLFLIAWELMSLASFFLVTFDDTEESTRRAGWVFLVAAHLGTVFLLFLFLLLGHPSGSLDFDRFSGFALQGPVMAGIAFILAVLGFGAKAGFIPLHVWLPEAHPAAPSHVSALMSAVMIKTGIYGLLRTLTFLGHPAPWWGWLLIAIGLTSGILGVLFALAQHDLKRLLAYHSVENIGIIALGLGSGVLGLALDQPMLAVLGFAGGLLHVLNHALFKGLLFLGAGSVLHATGTRDLDVLGGLGRRMPWTAALFLVGSVSICGLPPFNGFVSELLIYLGAFSFLGQPGLSVASTAVIAGLAVIGGLAAACFTKAFGIVFLGEPRSEAAAHGHEAGWAMRIPMLALALGCLAVGLFAPKAVWSLRSVLAVTTGFAEPASAAALEQAIAPLWRLVLGSSVFIALAGGLFLLRRQLLSGREVAAGPTWDCGYVRPTARMQYTASSFAQPLTSLFQVCLRTRSRGHLPEGLFPEGASLHTETADLFTGNLYGRLFSGVASLFQRLHWLQQGRVQFYILYLAVTLLFLLIWNLR